MWTFFNNEGNTIRSMMKLKMWNMQGKIKEQACKSMCMLMPSVPTALDLIDIYGFKHLCLISLSEWKFIVSIGFFVWNYYKIIQPEHIWLNKIHNSTKKKSIIYNFPCITALVNHIQISNYINCQQHEISMLKQNN